MPGDGVLGVERDYGGDGMTEQEKREKVIRGLECCIAYDYLCNDCPYADDGGAEDGCYSDELKTDALALLKAQEPITGETSDGYHTFNELYHHRAVLFSVIVANYPDRAWKSKKHHDGTMYDGMFIVGIETPDGQATYHYDIDPYWDMFKCRVLDNAPEWDGHTPAQAIERIGKLKAQEPMRPSIGGDADGAGNSWWYQCGKCEKPIDWQDNYCRHCGRAVKWDG